MRLCRNEVGRKPKRKERKVWTEAHGREGHVNPEAETGMGQPQAKDWQGWLVTPETERPGTDSPRGNQPCQQFAFRPLAY